MSLPKSVEAASESDRLTVYVLAIAVLLIHLLTSSGYGYNADELYFLACAKHLALGYIEEPPLSIFVLAAVHRVLGDSLLAIRLIPALTAASLVVLTAALAGELGGSRQAQILAAISVALAPVLNGVTSIFSRSSFEALFWTACAAIVARILRKRDERLWIPLGLVAALGLQNKHSMLFFGVGLAGGLLLTPARHHYKSKWLWFSAGIAALCFLPNLVWEAHYNWPTLEFLRNAQLYRNYPTSWTDFIVEQVMMMNPIACPIWLAGLYYYFCTDEGRTYRPLGWVYVIVLVLLIALSGKAYYLNAAYPLLLAPGSVVLERLVRSSGRKWIAPAYIGSLVLSGLTAIPFVLPILPPDTLIEYAHRLGMQQGIREERGEIGDLPENFSYMFGGRELAAATARAYEQLSATERRSCAIVASNYAEASAIDFFGPSYSLPASISGFNNYWLWGFGDGAASTAIVVRGPRSQLERLCGSVQTLATVRCRHCIPFEDNLPIYACRGLKVPLAELWPAMKNYTRVPHGTFLVVEERKLGAERESGLKDRAWYQRMRTETGNSERRDD